MAGFIQNCGLLSSVIKTNEHLTNTGLKKRVKLEASLAYALETSLYIFTVLITITWGFCTIHTFINI